MIQTHIRKFRTQTKLISDLAILPQSFNLLHFYCVFYLGHAHAIIYVTLSVTWFSYGQF